MTIDKWYVLTIDSPADIFNLLLSGVIVREFWISRNSLLRVEENSQKVESRNIFNAIEFVEKNFELQTDYEILTKYLTLT